MAATFPHLRLEKPRDGVAVVTLDNPDQRNAMSDEMTSSWGLVIDELKADPSVRAVVVTGAGTAFCSGGNTSWLASSPEATVDELRTKMVGFYRCWLRIRELQVPTIAAINGAAIGAGLSIALACDLRYAAEGAKMGVPFVKLGLHPGMATTWSLPDVIGLSAARDLLLTGRIVEAQEAVGLGLVSRALPRESFGDDVLEIASGIAETAPIASKLTTMALRGGGHRDIEAALQWEALAQPITMATADLQEGIAAVQAKRAPEFSGK